VASANFLLKMAIANTDLIVVITINNNKLIKSVNTFYKDNALRVKIADILIKFIINRH